MSINFDCLSKDHSDRFDYMHCLGSIKEGFIEAKYVDVDDICRFLELVKPTLYQMIDRLNEEGDNVGLSSVLEDVFAIVITIHERTKDKVDLLQEFNVIHDILNGYESRFGLKMKLSILKDIYDQCKIYYSRPTDELKEAKLKRQEDRIVREDYAFLNK